MSPGPEPTDKSDTERQRPSAALNHLLGEIGLPAGEVTQWWNLVGHQELGGRTATEAWLAGDTDEVRLLIEGWYVATRTAGQRAREDTALLTELRRKLSELDAHYGSSNTLHRTA
jgi:hypothetical protein